MNSGPACLGLEKKKETAECDTTESIQKGKGAIVSLSLEAMYTIDTVLDPATPGIDTRSRTYRYRMEVSIARYRQNFLEPYRQGINNILYRYMAIPGYGYLTQCHCRYGYYRYVPYRQYSSTTCIDIDNVYRLRYYYSY